MDDLLRHTGRVVARDILTTVAWHQPPDLPAARAHARDERPVAPEELGPVGVVLEIARCLRDISAGRVPK